MYIYMHVCICVYECMCVCMYELYMYLSMNIYIFIYICILYRKTTRFQDKLHTPQCSTSQVSCRLNCSGLKGTLIYVRVECLTD